MKFIIIDSDKVAAASLVKCIDSVISEFYPDETTEYTLLEDTSGIDCSIFHEVNSCLITEINLCGKTGLAVARCLIDQDNELPIVFCSDTNDYAMECYDLDIAYYLLKPVSKASVRKMVRRIRERIECED